MLIQLEQQKKVRRKEGPLGLIVAPTRELVEQIYQVCKEFTEKSGLKVTKIYGGEYKKRQEKYLYYGSDIIVSTPGRLIDFMENNKINLNKVQYLVMDEADRMLDLGFEIQLREICDRIRPDRHTCMFSATWPQDVQDFVNDYIEDYVYLQMGE